MSGFGHFGTFWMVSWVVWKIPARRAVKLAEFSHTEEGSSLDMLAAAESESVRPQLRRKFFLHALDEHRHAQWFAERATIMAPGRSQPHMILEDVSYIRDHGIRGDESLYEQLGEIEFLTFVWLQERQAGRQFGVYVRVLKDDPVTARMFEAVKEDERFHTNYSRLELDRLANAGQVTAVRRAAWRVRLRGFAQTWLRLARIIGDLMAGVWLLLLFAMLAPFALFARYFEPLKGGFLPALNGRERARSQAGSQA
jgi:hypothetical protein